MKPCVDSIDKSPEILGNALAPKMECADNYEGRIRALPGMYTWGYRARAPVRLALSNMRRARWTKRVKGAQRRNMNVVATVAKKYCIGDGGRGCWACRCGQNARNRACRLTTDMRTSQGQAAFGHNVQKIRTYLNISSFADDG
jgi:hypothetical protein